MKKGIFKSAASLILAAAMLLSLLPQMPVPVHAEEAPEINAANQQDIVLEPLSQLITATPGQLVPDTCQIIDSEIYGCVVDYEIKKGHTLFISNPDYVFSVRKLVDGNYSTMLKQATADSFTAAEDMTVGMLIRKPDKSAVTAEELASVVLYDTLYGMKDVPGSVHRFTVEAETIDGGTATTRAAVFLPNSYDETDTPTNLVIMTNGYSAYLTDSVWNGNTADNVGIIRSYLSAGYAVCVVNNTANRTTQTPDLGCPQLVSSYLEAYEYIQAHFNVGEKFAIHSRSFGTFAAMRLMQEVPELVNCAVMTGSRVSIKLAWSAVDKAFVANRFGFADATGATYEADKMVGHDPYTDVNGDSYAIPPTFWMMCEGDATTEPLEVIEKLIAHGNDVIHKTYSGTTHTGVCTLNTEVMFADAMEFLEAHTGYTHAVAESEGVQNAIDRAYALTDVTWTPLADMPGVQKIDGEYVVVPFEAGVTYKGIPYSGVTANDCYVGLNVSLESFLTALENKNSVLYTENLHSTNQKSATYFGTVCSKFAQYVLDIPGSYNTSNIPNIPGMDTIAMPGKYTVDDIKLGDIIVDTSHHTAVCTDILYDSQGNVAYIEISEAVMPLVRRLYWSPEEFYDKFANYRLCRYQHINDVPAVEEMSNASYALMPRYGNQYNYHVSSSAAVVDILEPGYAKAVILRDGVVIEEITISDTTETIRFDRSVPGYIEIYLEKADSTRSNSVYACVVEASVAVTDSSEFSSGKLTVTFDGSCGTPLYVQVGGAHAIFCNVEGRQGSAELEFKFSMTSSKQVRVAYQNEYGIYLSPWSSFTTAPNTSKDPLLSQGEYWDGYNLTPSGPTPVVQENKVGYWSYTMIPVKENTTYYSVGATRMWFLGADGRAISTYNAYKDSAVPFQFTTPAGTAYVSIAYAPHLVEKGTEALLEVAEDHVHSYFSVTTFPMGDKQGYTSYCCSTCGDSYQTLWLDPSAYEGMTIACIGDSITAAVGVTKDETDYVTLLAQQLGMDYIRLGASGTTLCTDGHRTCNIIRLTEDYLKGADVVTIAMGINDFDQAKEGYYELGDIHSTDTSTLYGAVRMWCERIVELRKTDSLSETQFYFVTPVITSWNDSVTSKRDWDQSKTTIHGYTLRDLCNAIIEVAALYDVPVIDLNLTSGMYYVSTEDNNIAAFGGDGVHPGEGGHAMMAAAIANALLQNNLRDDHQHTYGSWIPTTWPSCLAGEAQRICTVCSATESRTLESNGNHRYRDVITAPTDTEQGYTTHTCAICGDCYVDSYVDPLVLAGDVNGDGKVNTLDRVILSRYLAKWEGYDDSSLNLTAADVNQDGKVNTLDRVILSRHLAKWSGYEVIPVVK